MAQALARIKPARLGMPATPKSGVAVLSRRQKAAIIVRLMLAEGSPIPIAGLPESLQAELAQQIGTMRLVDRETLDHVISEFMSELEQVGLSFPGGLEGALAMMDGHLSSATASRLRRSIGLRPDADPWDRITALPPDRLQPVLDEESTEIAAVMLSKLPVQKAAMLLGKLPGDKARRVAFAMSHTGNVDPATVRRIGISLLTQLDGQPLRAFDAGPVERVGAILNVSPELTREDVLKGLEEADAGFAEQVRRAIFTFVHLPHRLLPRDVPKLIRAVDQPTLVTALCGAQSQPDRRAAADFILENMSQRMAQALREEVAERGKVRDKDVEAAMNQIVSAIRRLEADRDITLITPEDED